MKKITKLFFICIALFFPGVLFAGSPLFTLTPLTATAIQLPVNRYATVQYNVQNQSAKTHVIVMESMTGINQITSAGNCPNPFTLAAKQSCTLTLQITGSQLTGDIYGGPKICQQGSSGQPDPLLCYQPSPANLLNITLGGTQVTFYSGTQNGNIFYSTNTGATWTATTQPGGGSPVNSIFATNTTLYAALQNGFIYYSTNNGSSWSSTTSPDGSAVNCVFVINNILYASTENGFVYYSTNGGNNWVSSSSSPDGSAVNSIFVTASAIYAGTAYGNVYFSTNNGATWISIDGQPDGSQIKNVFVNNNTVYVDTANEFVYSSTSLTGGGAWTMIAQTVYSLFVNSDNTLYAGSQSGFVFSITGGTELGFVTASPINSVFVLN